jgi:hypothetical protein
MRDSKRIFEMYSSSFFSFEKATKIALTINNMPANSFVKLSVVIVHRGDASEAEPKESGNKESTLNVRNGKKN